MPAPRPAKLDLPFQTDDEILDLVSQFESCRWPYERWTHCAHLAVATVYLTQYPFPEALNRIRQHIQAYNHNCGDPDGYHETITVLFLTLISRFLSVHCDSPSLADTVSALVERFDAKTPLEYYSPDLLSSSAAKKAWVEPNRKPVPPIAMTK